MKKPSLSVRPYKTDYGISSGHCKTRESALIAAFKQIVIQRLSHVTVESPDGEVICRLRLNREGVHIWAPSAERIIDPMTRKRPKLNRVA